MFEAPRALPNADAMPVAPPPPHPASPSDIYVYPDAHGVIHFTSYLPTDDGARVYLRARTRPGP